MFPNSSKPSGRWQTNIDTGVGLHETLLNHLGDGKPLSISRFSQPLSSKPSGRWQTSIFDSLSANQLSSKPSGRWQTNSLDQH